MPLSRRGSYAVGLLCACVSLLGGGAVVGCQQQSSEDLAQADAAIIGGKLDVTHKGVVSLLKQTQGGYYPACSGTLLTPNLVLTAHHCVAALNSADGSSVECGKTQFKALDRANTMLISVEANVGAEGLQPFRVTNVWVPDGSADVCGRDIALLLLSGAGVPANEATPIEPNLAKELAPNEVFSAIGYGLQDPNDTNGQTAGHRMAVTTAQVYCEGTACGTALVKDGEFIADSPVCSGDSGGPALDKNGRVGGVTSRGDQKCTVGIYSGVSAWRDFIVAKAFVAAQSGNYAPPPWAGDPPTGTGGTGGSNTTGGSGGAAGSANGGGGASSAGGGNGGSGGSGGNGMATAGSSSAGSGPLFPVGGTFNGTAGTSASMAGSSAGGIASSGNVSPSPTINPLGLSCTGHCPGSYKCWAESGTPPGICVPECSADDTTCPADFTCSTNLGACVKSTAVKSAATAHESSSCSVTAPGALPFGKGEAWLGLALLGFGWRGRRRARR